MLELAILIATTLVSAALAWGIDVLAEKRGWPRTLAVFGVLPLLGFALWRVWAIEHFLAPDYPPNLIHGFRAYESSLMVITSISTSFAAMALLGPLSWRAGRGLRKGHRVDAGTVLLAVLALFVGVGIAAAATLPFGRPGPFDPPLPDLWFAVPVGVACVLTVVGSGTAGLDPDPILARLRVENAVLLGTLTALASMGLFARAADEVFWYPWSVYRAGYREILVGSLRLAGSWSLAPLLVALVLMIRVMPAIRGTAALRLLPVAGLSLLLAAPVVLLSRRAAAEAWRLDFEPVVEGVSLPVSRYYNNNPPSAGCVDRVTPDGLRRVSTHPPPFEIACSMEDLAVPVVAPAGTLVRELDGQVILANDYDTAEFYIRTTHDAPYPIGVAWVEHDPAGLPMANRTLQEVYDTCVEHRTPCNLSPWVR